LNKKHDFREWELGQAMWMDDGSVDMSNYHSTPEVYAESNPSALLPSVGQLFFNTPKPLLHGCYASGVAAGKYTASAKCIATVRHPIDRVISVIYFPSPPKYPSFNPAKDDLNEYVSERLDGHERPVLFQDQHKLYNDAPILWNTENIHEHATAYFATNGGVIRQRWHARRNGRRPPGIADQLTSEIKQKILTRYEKDFLLWEKAYAVYN
jgi:hypothetical protein